MCTKSNSTIIPPLSRMKNNNPVFLSSRGDNFLFKNIKFSKIRQKFEIFWNFLKILIFKKIQQFWFFLKIWKFWNFGFSKFWKFLKIFEKSIFEKSEKIKISKFSNFLNFWRILKNYIFLKRKLSPLELRNTGLLVFMWESGGIMHQTTALVWGGEIKEIQGFGVILDKLSVRFQVVSQDFDRI